MTGGDANFKTARMIRSLIPFTPYLARAKTLPWACSELMLASRQSAVHTAHEPENLCKPGQFSLFESGSYATYALLTMRLEGVRPNQLHTPCEHLLALSSGRRFRQN